MLRIFEGEKAVTVDKPKGSRKGRGKGRLHYNYQLTAVTPLLILTDIAAAVPAITGLIRSTRRRRTCGSYLFISPAREVFVLSEESHVATDWVRTRLSWLVALYHPRQVTLRTPAGLGPTVDFDLEGLAEDIAEHLQGLAP